MFKITAQNWWPIIKENYFTFLTIALVMFIPLWPKIPLFQPIPGYIVRIRLEDLFVGAVVSLWIIQVLRQKFSIVTPLNKYIGCYVLAGLVSLLSAFFFIKTLPLELPHVGKAFLHLLRYIEYFSLFYLTYAAIQKKIHYKWFVRALAFTVVLVSLYGVGQKFWTWPVYSTMNYEFSSGEALQLISQQARVQSTFAGHYDFAIFLALILPFLLVEVFTQKKRSQQLFFGSVFLLGLWSLIVSGLRSAFASYVIESTLVVLLLTLRLPNWRVRFQWGGLRLAILYGVTGVMFVVFGNNLAALLDHAVIGVLFPQPQNTQTQQTIIDQYVLPVPKDQVEQVRQTIGTPPLQLSGCALQREVSLCIRLESLWPQAIQGFYRQPVVGSGYSSLNKRDFHHLSEADGADNNYLRILGETGILGFLTFFSILAVAASLSVKQVFSKNSEMSNASIAYIGALIGLLGNALLFDVFAASKVAFTFWALTGIVLGRLKLKK